MFHTAARNLYRLRKLQDTLSMDQSRFSVMLYCRQNIHKSQAAIKVKYKSCSCARHEGMGELHWFLTYVLRCRMSGQLYITDHLLPGKDQEPIQYEAGLGRQPVWTFWKKRIIPFPYRVSTPHLSSRSLVTIPTTVVRFLHKSQALQYTINLKKLSKFIFTEVRNSRVFPNQLFLCLLPTVKR